MTITQLISDVRREIRWLAYGAVFFWLPDILVHVIARDRFDTPQVWLVTALCPISLLVGYYVLAHLSDRKVTGLNSALMVVGMWCLGGITMMISASFTGGGFSGDGRGSTVLISLLAMVCPPITFIMATYDGSLLALILGTVLMCAEAATLSARFAQPKLWKAVG